MKFFRILILSSCIALLTNACGKKTGEHDHHAQDTVSNANQQLYDEVMGIHDEVMPKMNDLYKTKTALKTRLELPGLSETEKQDINTKLARIDSASESMMVWMRQFDPLPDSEGQDKAREYLEAQLAKVRKVREDILEASKITE